MNKKKRKKEVRIICVLKKMAADRLTGKLTLEQSPEGGEGVRHADLWGRSRWGAVSKEGPRRAVGKTQSCKTVVLRL